MSVGVVGMVEESAADEAAILSCYRPTVCTGWEIRTGGAWAVKTTQIIDVITGATTGPAEINSPTNAVALPHSMAMRPFFIALTIDIDGNATSYFNGVLEAQNAITGGMLAANGDDSIVLGHGYDNAGAVARPGAGCLVYAVMLADVIKTAAQIADTYRDLTRGVIPSAVGWDHTWLAEDAKLGNGLGETASTWYSRVPSAGTPKVFTADVDDGLRVDYYPNIAFAL
jgi:hypothetical protein